MSSMRKNPYRGTTLRSLRIPEEVWTAALERAAVDGTTVSDIVRARLIEYAEIETPDLEK